MDDSIRFNTYSDESGQDTDGKIIYVCTICIDAGHLEYVSALLQGIESKSKKYKKWYQSSNSRRESYCNYLLSSDFFRYVSVYCSLYENKKDFTSLIGSHITKSIINYTSGKGYKVKIFIDKMDKKSLERIKQEIKEYRISYKFIKGIKDENSELIRFVDAMCGMFRDKEKKSSTYAYKKIFSRSVRI